MVCVSGIYMFSACVWVFSGDSSYLLQSQIMQVYIDWRLISLRCESESSMDGLGTCPGNPACMHQQTPLRSLMDELFRKLLN